MLYSVLSIDHARILRSNREERVENLARGSTPQSTRKFISGLLYALLMRGLQCALGNWRNHLVFFFTQVVPLHMRTVSMDTIAFFWDMYLTLAISKDSSDKSDPQDAPNPSGDGDGAAAAESNAEIKKQDEF